MINYYRIKYRYIPEDENTFFEDNDLVESKSAVEVVNNAKNTVNEIGGRYFQLLDIRQLTFDTKEPEEDIMAGVL